ncbi:MAG TPA: restriction endonuclease subunit S [Candidatus Thiothrix moscowensis]|uniref:restriction endonuclease subunit S n=1 Tax=unclassified Thiothrix TaxID=2636184 RepID=UPI0025F25142|nr:MULTISPECIES: restriction endonuclease subunit S [unclassified Thiothrix]HRJ53715.1 restriction endonuclease subunit S [Candidatus Thiothrix moscowensis]HRJ93797.1 restriction endonuclease subunit S [Candidatus Thiothrix moscowensis]
MELDNQWIGNAPASWEKVRLKDVAFFSPSYSAETPNTNEICTVIPMEAVSEQGQVHDSEQRPYETISSGLTLFEVGDVIFAKITPCMENGKGAFIASLPTRYAFGSTEFHVMRPFHKIDGRFLYYYTFNPTYRKYAEVNMVGAAGQKRVSTRFLKYTPLYLPDVEEQRRIAGYLDQQCAAIDGAIAVKQQQLEKLEQIRRSVIYRAVTKGLDDTAVMQETHIDWIGKVPAHWQASRIKNVAELSPRFSGEKPSANEEYAVVPMEDVSDDGQISIKQIKSFNDISSGLTYFENGDVIFAKITPCMENGKGAFVTSLPTRYAFGSTEFHVLRPNRVNGEFLYYYTYNTSFRDYAEVNMVGAAGQKRVSSTFLKTTPIYLPSTEEQAQIVAWVKAELDKIQQARAVVSRQVEVLAEYKKSLIHECVTGKRRVVV